MSKTIELKQQEDTLSTTDNTGLTFRNIENTPFTIVKEDENYYGIIGTHRITDRYENEKELEEELVKINWDRITQVIWAITEKYREIKEDLNNENK